MKIEQMSTFQHQFAKDVHQLDSKLEMILDQIVQIEFGLPWEVETLVEVETLSFLQSSALWIDLIR